MIGFCLSLSIPRKKRVFVYICFFAFLFVMQHVFGMIIGAVLGMSVEETSSLHILNARATFSLKNAFNKEGPSGKCA